MEIRVFPDAASTADAAARSLARRIGDAVRRRGRADIAVSGGRTPAAMFVVMVDLTIPWHDLHIWQIDERVAPDGDPDRNLGLLAVLPMPATNVHAMGVSEENLVRSASAYASGLPSRFDVVHLGLGGDGHTASWPPGDPVIDSSASVAITEPYKGRVRMTLTPSVVNSARSRLVVATGADKAVPFRQWLLEDRSVPIHRVRIAGTTVFIDEAAASASIVGLHAPA